VHVLRTWSLSGTAPGRDTNWAIRRSSPLPARPTPPQNLTILNEAGWPGQHVKSGPKLTRRKVSWRRSPFRRDAREAKGRPPVLRAPPRLGQNSSGWAWQPMQPYRADARR
jgi:hypothetical protein